MAKTVTIPPITIQQSEEESLEEEPDQNVVESPLQNRHPEDAENLETIPEENSLPHNPNPFSRFLEIEHEEKVELEMSKSKGLVISPSTAFLYGLVKEEAKNAKSQSNWAKYKGIIFGFSASFFFSLTVIMVKILKDYDPLAISVWRYSGIFVPSLPIVFYYQVIRRCQCCQNKKKSGKRPPSIFQTVFPLNEKDKIYNFIGLMLRGLLGCTSVLLRFYSLNYLSVADSAVISYSGPIFVVIVAHFCLGEKCGFIPILAAIFTSIGVFVISRPPIFTGQEAFDANTLIGTAVALLSMICNSTVVILMRKIRKVHSALMLLTFGTWGVVESIVVAGSFGVLEFPHGVRDSTLMLFVLPALVFMGQMSIILAVKYENAGPISLIRSCDVIFSFIWQFIFLNESPKMYSLIGATMVVLCVAMTTMRKYVSSLPREDLMRKKLRIFLM